MTSAYEQEQKDLQSRVIALRETLSKPRHSGSILISSSHRQESTLRSRNLDAEIIQALVERIDVFKAKKVPGTRTKKQTILHWNFIGAVELLQDLKKSA